MPQHPKHANSHQYHQDPFACPTASNPPTPYSLVAIKGQRGGYVQLAPAHPVTTYGDTSPEIFLAARDWATRMETHIMGIARMYWLTFSEVVPHFHIHLYPRYRADTLKGTALFEAREEPVQPGWSPEQEALLTAWCQQWGVFLLPHRQ